MFPVYIFPEMKPLIFALYKIPAKSASDSGGKQSKFITEIFSYWKHIIFFINSSFDIEGTSALSTLIL